MKNAERLMSGALALSILASTACSSEVEKPQASEPGIEATVPYLSDDEQFLSRTSTMLQMSELDALDLKDTYIFNTAHSETIIMVLDDYELNKSRTQKTIDFLENYVPSLGIADLKIFTPDGQEYLTPTLRELSPDANHRMVIVPENTDTTRSVGRAQGSFTYLPNNGESYTVILNESGTSPIINIPKNLSNLNTELCQSVSRVRVRDEAVTQFGETVAAVAQEAFCNGLGRALSAAQSGLIYAEYIEAYGGKKLSVGDLMGEFFVVDEQTYLEIPK